MENRAWDGRAWFHCGKRLLVAGGQGQDFVVREPCPAGVEPGLAVMDLYDRCLRCPVARRKRAEEGAR